MVASSWGPRSGDHAASRFRVQLGLPTRGPVLMSGHQAEFWHPGILAKLFAISAAAAGIDGATGAWITVDQDAGDPWRLVLPTASAERIEWRLSPAPGADVPTGGQPPMRSETAGPPSGLLSGAAAGAARIVAALRTGGETAAAQVQAALATLTAAFCPPPVWFLASAIARTDAFAAIVAEMATDAGACIERYNAGVTAHPGAGMRPLETGARIELPLWRLTPGGPRRRVYADEVGSIPVAQLAPRALLMTALLRRFGCDLFVHGLGGAVYDRVTEAWIGAWRPGWTLAPTAMVTATRFLRFDGLPPIAPPAEIARAHWLAHRAMHDPAVVGDDRAAAEKAQRVARIRAARERGERPREMYRWMHEALEVYRRENRRPIEALRARAAALEAESGRAGVVYDRTWAFPLYPESEMASLAAEVRAAFARA